MELPKNANQLNRSELENILEEIHDEVDTLLDLEDEELRQKPELLKERASRLKVKMKEYLRYCRELKKKLITEGCHTELQFARDKLRSLHDDCVQSLLFINERLKQLNNEEVSSLHFGISSIRSDDSLTSQLEEPIFPAVRTDRPVSPVIIESGVNAPRDFGALPAASPSLVISPKTVPLQSTLAPSDKLHNHPTSTQSSRSNDLTPHIVTSLTHPKFSNDDADLLSLAPDYSTMVPQRLNRPRTSAVSSKPPQRYLNPQNTLNNVPSETTPTSILLQHQTNPSPTECPPCTTLFQTNVTSPLNPNAQDVLTMFANRMLQEDFIKKTIDSFDGTPTQFWPWAATVREYAEALRLSPRETLQLWETNSTGRPRAIIKARLTSGKKITSEDLHSVGDKLQRLYGATGKIADELISRIERFPVIRGTNQAEQLQELLDHCEAILQHMEHCPELCVMNVATGTRSIRYKLPEHLQLKWRSVGLKYQETHGGKQPPFEVLVDFLNRQVIEMSDDNYAVKVREPANESDTKPATRVLQSSVSSNASPQKICPVHQSASHSILDCRSFKRLQYYDKQKLVNDHQLCCYCLGHHTATDCTAQPRCGICKQNHITLLHREREYLTHTHPDYG